MKLAIILEPTHICLTRGVLALLTVVEDTAGPWWSQAWSDTAITSSQLQKWLASLGISGEVKPPMAGGVGRAYPVGNEFIVKFTTDANEARAAAIMKGHNSPHAADIYGVVLVKSEPNQAGKNVNLYAIAMQRLNTDVGAKMKSAADAVYRYIDDNDAYIEDPEATINTIIAKYLKSNERQNNAIRVSVKKLVMALYDVQQKTGVLSQDPHGGNVALKGREPAFFDFGRSKSDYDHPKASGARIPNLQ